MTLDALMPPASIILSAVLLAILLVRRVYRALPLFVAYQIYSVAESIAMFASVSQLEFRLQMYVAANTLDTVFYLCVLAELGSSLLRHNKAATHELLTAALLFVPFCMAVWPLATWTINPSYSLPWQLALFVVQILGTVPLAGFLSLAVWSHMKRLSWPARELRIVTGMGSWALVSFVASVLHSHGLFAPENEWVDLLTPVSCLIVMLYWIYSFWLEPDIVEKTSVASEKQAVGRRQPSPHHLLFDVL